ncbi:Phosphate acetyltransferase [hydrothermal vent metagenome]|uniref:Phosphate acetyltransferase n=1 Tax=hydrothermal vent metagenome TaxID=652676 RepID=A0A3B1BPM4_9ZZZZ
MEGVLAASEAGLIRPVLLGKPEIIRNLCRELGCNADRFTIIEADSESAAAQTGVEQVLAGKAHALIKGWIHTDALMRPVLAQLRSTRRISHIFITELPRYPKLLYITDAAINIAPDLTTKMQIVQNAVDLLHMLGVKCPAVAALSAVELVKPAIPSTLDAACLSKMAQRGQISGAILDGPLAFDNAISSEAAKTKHIHSDVAGNADILLVPDLDAGNILAKDLEYLAGATIAGIVIGAQVPIMLPSRSDPPTARLASAAIAVLMHHLWPDYRHADETITAPS